MIRNRSKKPAGLFALLLSTALLAPLAIAQATKPATESDKKAEDVVHLEKVEVTGSRIKRLDTEGASPIKIVTREDLALSGHVSLTDFVRDMPEAAFTQTNESSTLGAVRGATALDLRGMGMQNTLTLINGRRAVLSGVAQSSGSTFVDIGRIPMSMVERIEILKDGASAIYGADATAGVVNIITRKDYNGLEVAMSYGNTLTKTDVAEKNISIFGGVSTGKLRATVSVAHSERNALKATDTDFANTGDLTSRVLSEKKNDSNYDLYEEFAYIYGLYDLRSGSGPIARIRARDGSVLNGTSVKTLSPSFTNPYTQGTGGVFTPAAVATFEAQRLAIGDPVSNKYDAQKDVWLLPEVKQTAFASSFRYDFSPKVEGYLDLAYAEKRSYIEYAPSPISTDGDNKIYVPASNYWNPFGQDIAFNWRLTEGGPRAADISYDTYSILAGIKGTILDRFDWDFGYTYGKDKAVDKGINQLSESRFRAALARTDAKALNIFGGENFKNDPDTVKSLFLTTEKKGQAELTLFDLKLSGPIVEVPWIGEIQGAIYTEYREETFATSNDAASTTLDDVIGLVRLADPTDAFRTVKSIAAEVDIPLVKKATIPGIYSAELAIAARFEDFSDGYDSGWKPYYGLRWQIDKNVLLRASYTEAFRAPSLPQLYAGVSQGLLDGLPDYSRPYALTGDPDDGSSMQRLILTGGNPNLKPEKAKSYQVGTVVDLGYVKWLKGLSVEFTIGEIKQTEVISSLSTSFLRQNEWGDAAGMIDRDSATAGTFTNNTSSPINVYVGPGRYNDPAAMQTIQPGQSITLPGKILRLNTSYLNLALKRIRYTDFAVKYNKKLTNWGRIFVGVNGTYTIDYDSRSNATSAKVNYVDWDWIPRYRVQSFVGWDYKQWSTGLQNNYLPGNGKLEDEGWRTACYSTWSGHVSYKIPAGNIFSNMQVTVDVLNIFDKEPPLYALDANAYQQVLIGRPQGRFMSISLKKEF